MPSELLNTVSPVRCLSTTQPMAIAGAIRHKPLKKKTLTPDVCREQHAPSGMGQSALPVMGFIRQ